VEPEGSAQFDPAICASPQIAPLSTQDAHVCRIGEISLPKIRR
jgi:hypothetical protein